MHEKGGHALFLTGKTKKLKGQTAKTEDRLIDPPERNEAPRDTKNEDVRIEHRRFIHTCESPIPSYRMRTNHAADDFMAMRTEDRSKHDAFLTELSLVAPVQRFSEFSFDKREIFFHRRIEERQSDAETQYDAQHAEMKQAHIDCPLTNFDIMISLAFYR
jgi:hypothetical protein